VVIEPEVKLVILSLFSEFAATLEENYLQPSGLRAFRPAVLSLIGQRPQRVLSFFASSVPLRGTSSLNFPI
jgi:hypothetical protein